MDPRIDLNSLMLFYEVIEAGSLTAASVKLKLSKSTVSRRLSRLEQQFGSILVKKSGHKLVLTEVGVTLHRGCQQIVANVLEATQQAFSAHADLQGSLRVSIPGELGIVWIGSIVAEFMRMFPDISMDVRLNNSDLVDPTKEPFDVAIQVGEKRLTGPICKSIATLPRGVYASPAYLERRGTPRSFEECRAHDWIVTDVQVRDGILLFQESKRRKAIDVPGKIVANSARLARELATAGLGLAMIPEGLCEDRVRDGRLVRVLPDWQCPALHIAALFLSRDRIPRKTRLFLDFFAKRLSTSSREARARVSSAALR